jgi:hypothetical protein
MPPDLDMPNWRHLVVGLVCLATFLLAIYMLQKYNYRKAMVAGFGFILILLTNLTHGFQFGLARDVDGGYLNGSVTFESPVQFLSEYESNQDHLSLHAQTHPPGPVLLFWTMERGIPHAGLIAALICLLAVILIVLLLTPILESAFDSKRVGYYIFLYLLIPSVQIYYATSIDAIIAALVIGSSIHLFVSSRISVIVSVICLITVSMLTFLSLFILPVLIVYELWTKNKISRSALVISSLIVFHLALYLCYGFNYLNSFLIASSIETSRQILILVEPINHFSTRIEGIAEILLFFGPFLTLFLFQALSKYRTDPMLNKLTIIAIGTFLLMLGVGVYRTGETARAALFMYPFLLLPTAYWISKQTYFTTRRMQIIAALVFGQALLMQMIGFYYW